MTRWFHRCDLEWLQARQTFLTATDVKELLPFTKTGRKRAVTDEVYFKILARKQVNLTEDDCISTGAAARGHILEPYAIDRYNKKDFGSNTWLYHWDDTIITRSNPALYNLGFSPDAVNFEQVNYERNYAFPYIKPSQIKEDIKVIGEVKSYSPERHMIAGYTPKDKLEERWQIATAMAVCESIEEAYLLFYNPSMTEQLYIVDYTRADLADEIEVVEQIEKDWFAWLKNLNTFDKHYTVNGNPTEEQQIIANIIARENLNPSDEKSVIV